MEGVVGDVKEGKWGTDDDVSGDVVLTAVAEDRGRSTVGRSSPPGGILHPATRLRGLLVSAVVADVAYDQERGVVVVVVAASPAAACQDTKRLRSAETAAAGIATRLISVRARATAWFGNRQR